MKTKNLSHFEKDVLREIGNIGAGNATASMSELINKQVKMEVPSVKVVTINEMMEIIGGPERLVVSIFFRFEGEVTGTVYFILTLEEAEYLVSKMTNNHLTKIMENGEPNQMAVSVLQEVANILNGSYLSAMADFTSLRMKTTIPYLSIDMAAATIVTGLVELSRSSDYAILIDTQITSNDKDSAAHGHFLLLPDPESIPKLFAALGIDL
ncbi:MAG TPA: chemotaxis protein CheC [Pseudogracilibacillus sp.]|nr:chemotaxis protein CheC [Pseudogracilibacillus sp.]